MASLEFFWDFSSPFAYLASTQLTKMVERTGATVVDRPLLLGGLFRSIGQVDVPLLGMSKPKQEHVRADLFRWAKHYGVPFVFPSRFPTSSVKALRAYLALPESERPSFRDRVMAAYWAEDRDIADDAVLGELLGANASTVMPKLADPAIKQALHDATNLAVTRGVFGIPTFVVNETELFWGQDRLVLVEESLM